MSIAKQHLIERQNGRLPIDQIAVGDRVLTDQMRYRSVTAITVDVVKSLRSMGTPSVLLSCLSDEDRALSVILEAADLVLRDGEWVLAKDIKEGDKIACAGQNGLHPRIATVKKVVSFRNVNRGYKLAVEEDNSFAANWVFIRTP